HRTTASRSSSTPASPAARAPIVPPGSTIAAHSPAEVAAAASVSATVVDPEPGAPPTAIVLPRWTPPAGRSAPIGPRTGSRRSPGQRHPAGGDVRPSRTRTRPGRCEREAGEIIEPAVGRERPGQRIALVVDLPPAQPCRVQPRPIPLRAVVDRRGARPDRAAARGRERELPELGLVLVLAVARRRTAQHEVGCPRVIQRWCDGVVGFGLASDPRPPRGCEVLRRDDVGRAPTFPVER